MTHETGIFLESKRHKRDVSFPREHYVMGAESARIFNPIMPRIPMIIASNIVTLLEGFHQTSSSIFLLYSKWPFKIPA